MKHLLTCSLFVILCLGSFAQGESNQDFDDLYEDQPTEVIVDQPQPKPNQESATNADREKPSKKSDSELLEEVVVDLEDFVDRLQAALFDVRVRIETEETEIDLRANDVHMDKSDLRDLERDLEEGVEDVQNGIDEAVEALYEARAELEDARREVDQARRELHRDREFIETIAVLHVFEHIGFGIIDGLFDTAEWILDF